jgi:Uma2 family endonuclease
MEAPATIRAPRAVMWTREDCQKFEAMGALPDRWELVQGEIVSKMGTNRPHGKLAAHVANWLARNFPAAQYLIASKIDVAPEDNPTSEPEPDLTILRDRSEESSRNPIPAEIALLIEVSDSTIRFDLGPKADLYARAGIEEYWVVDINARVIHQHREPSSGGYNFHRTVTGINVLSPLAKPEATLTPAEIFE